jgi:tetratricopeptide (TPR) repeat protein
MTPPPAATRWYVAVLCMLGALRVFLGSAALPLFNNVDEQAHFDLVHKYASGTLPLRPHEYWDRETAELQTLHGSAEFLNRPEAFPGGVYPPPVWTWPPSTERDDYVNRKSAAAAHLVNHEAHSPPLYYLAGAVWYRLGRAVGLQGAGAAYWVRFMNVPLFALLVAAAYSFCSAYFSPFVALAVPTLLAFFPSALFFSITSDALSPLLVLLALRFLLAWHGRTRPSARLSVLVGLLAAAAFLVKVTNGVILAACGLLVALRWRQAQRAGTLRNEWPHGGLLLAALGLPVGAWMTLNALFLGDPTGTAGKVAELGWLAKPVGALFDHPLFTLAGQRTFWNGLAVSFFEGDLYWLGRPVTASVPVQAFSLAAFALLPFTLGLAWHGRTRAAAARLNLAGVLCALVPAGMVALLMGLSLRWDFGTGFYPSRWYPYLCSGRLISGAIVPLLVICAWSLEAAFGRVKPLLPVLVALPVAMLAAHQAPLLVGAAASRYNWFHLATAASEAERFTGSGLVALSGGRLDEAARRFSQAVAADPADLCALANLGQTLDALGSRESAIRAFTRALALQPDSAVLHNSRGSVFAALEAWAAAAADHGEAVRLAPQTPFYRFPLAHALVKQGQPAAAAEQVAAALRQASDWPKLRDRPTRRLAEHLDPAVRRRLAARAVQRAEQADRVDGSELTEALAQLAAAYADAERFEEAAAAASQGLGVAEGKGAAALAARFRAQLDAYRRRQYPIETLVEPVNAEP